MHTHTHTHTYLAGRSHRLRSYGLFPHAEHGTGALAVGHKARGRLRPAAGGGRAAPVVVLGILRGVRHGRQRPGEHLALHPQRLGALRRQVARVPLQPTVRPANVRAKRAGLSR